jgi:hypothetical protein
MLFVEQCDMTASTHCSGALPAGLRPGVVTASPALSAAAALPPGPQHPAAAPSYAAWQTYSTAQSGAAHTVLLKAAVEQKQVDIISSTIMRCLKNLQHSNTCCRTSAVIQILALW